MVVESPDGVRLLLENASGGGDTVGASIEELAAILDGIAEAAPAHRFGFCLDTAHLWGAGYDIGSAEGVAQVLDRFDELVGLDRLHMVHLNDSRSELGSRVDRHEHLGAGRIGAAGLTHLLRHPALVHAAYILETPGMDVGYDAVNLARAHDLFAGRALEPLPPEAFEEAASSSARTGPS